MYQDNVRVAFEIVSKIDGMFKKGEFEQVDFMLKDINVEGLTDQELVSYLTASYHGKARLPSRQGFYHKAEESLRSRGRDTKSLLHGLE